MPDAQTTPAIGQTWASEDGKRRLVIRDLSARKVVYHNARRELRSMTKETLAAKYVRITTNP